MAEAASAEAFVAPIPAFVVPRIGLVAKHF
jgi:hypothetical protein